MKKKREKILKSRENTTIQDLFAGSLISHATDTRFGPKVGQIDFLKYILAVHFTITVLSDLSKANSSVSCLQGTICLSRLSYLKFGPKLGQIDLKWHNPGLFQINISTYSDLSHLGPI